MLKRLISSALALSLVFGGAAMLPEGVTELGSPLSARAVYYDSYSYKVLDDGTVEITRPSVSAQDLEIVIPSDIDGKTVTSIGYYAFSNCELVTSITIPNTVTNIGNHAFAYSRNVKSITLPSSLTTIDNHAFCKCESLTSIVIPDSVTNIGYGAFSGCESLTTITIPNSVTSLGDYAFASCLNLKSVTIPDTITKIGDDAFAHCYSLANITIPESITSIGDSAFLYCYELTSLTIPKSVTNIGSDAFYDCDKLTIKCYYGSAAEKYAKDNKIKYELLDAPAHTHTYTSKVVKPTYDAQGYTLHTCSCGDSYKDNYKAKLTRTSIAKATVSGLKSKYYTGKAITQKPVIKLGGKTLKAGTDYTAAYKNNKAVGTATVTFTGKGAYTGSVKATFKICPKKTAVKKLTSPKTKQLKVTYNKVAGVTGYQVTYSTSSKFTKKTTKSASSTGTSKTIKKLTKGKTYYVKVRTYKTVNGTKYYSGYSAVKKIKAK